MYKIKDNVDLKELEKYGFKYNSMYYAYTKVFTYGFFTRHINIYIDNPRFQYREMRAYSSIPYDLLNDEYIESVIQDLIDADLVEKVEDK